MPEMFILDSRITSTIQRLTITSGTQAARHRLDLIYPVKSRPVMQSVHNDGSV
jgi:hypothetical protein